MSHEALGEQLAAFMTAGEIQKNYRPLEGDRARNATGGLESNAELWSRKAGEARLGPRTSPPDWDNLPTTPERGSRAEAFLREGVKHPVQLQVPSGGARPEVLGGHHRIAVMAEHDPHALLPVTHWDSFEEAQSSRTYPYEGPGALG